MDPKREEIEYHAALPMAKIAVAPMAKALQWIAVFSAIMLIGPGLSDWALEPTTRNVVPLALPALLLSPMLWFTVRQIRRTRQRGIGTCIFASGLIIISIWSTIVVSTRESPRQRANFIECASQMRMIGEAMAAYVGQHGEWPASLRDLANAQLPRHEVYVICPASPVVESMDWTQRWPPDVAPSYIYIRPAEAAPPEPVVVLYEDLYHFDGHGMNLLMSDGTVRQLRDDAALARWIELSESAK